MKNENTKKLGESTYLIQKIRSGKRLEKELPEMDGNYSESSLLTKKIEEGVPLQNEIPDSTESYSESSKMIRDYHKKPESEVLDDKCYSESSELVYFVKSRRMPGSLDTSKNPHLPSKSERVAPVRQKEVVSHNEVRESETHEDKPTHIDDNSEKPKVTPIDIASDTHGLHLVIKSEGQSVKARRVASNTAHVFGLIFTYAFLIVAALLFIFPFYWMIITSFKSGAEIQGFLPGHEGQQTFWPIKFVNNYADLNKKFNFGMYVSNTLIVGLFSTIGTIFTCIFAAFAFARLKFKGKDIMFALMLSTMMIPGEMMVITNYVTVSNFGWTNGQRTGAYLAMIIPFMISVFYIYLLRQNFLQIPNELYLAAKVDGKSDWQYLWKVMVPLAMPSLVTIFILKLMGSWNSYIWPNLVAGGNDQFKLVSNGLRDSFQTGTNFDEYGRQMAATVCVTLPLLLVFICFRKYIMRGVSRAGIKG